MNDQHYTSLEHKIDKLIKLCTQLHKENSALLKKQAQWQSENAELIRKNDTAVKKLKEMITRLQALEKN